MPSLPIFAYLLQAAKFTHETWSRETVRIADKHLGVRQSVKNFPRGSGGKVHIPKISPIAATNVVRATDATGNVPAGANENQAVDWKTLTDVGLEVTPVEWEAGYRVSWTSQAELQERAGLVLRELTFNMVNALRQEEDKAITALGASTSGAVGAGGNRIDATGGLTWAHLLSANQYLLNNNAPRPYKSWFHTLAFNAVMGIEQAALTYTATGGVAAGPDLGEMAPVRSGDRTSNLKPLGWDLDFTANIYTESGSPNRYLNMIYSPDAIGFVPWSEINSRNGWIGDRGDNMVMFTDFGALVLDQKKLVVIETAEQTA